MKHYELLIVDDERRFADALAKRLRLRGCHCDVRYSGQEALDTLKRKHFFLIILDLHLPDIYGTKVLAQIKKMNAETHVIIVTGHGTEKDRHTCMQLGAYAFRHKPLGIEDLMTILDQIEISRENPV
jgi:DNA-binding NtrC family response regulator